MFIDVLLLCGGSKTVHKISAKTHASARTSFTARQPIHPELLYSPDANVVLLPASLEGWHLVLLNKGVFRHLTPSTACML